MVYGVLLIILGLLAAPSLLLSKKPDAAALLNKITPYQGWIGIAACFTGVWWIIQAILNLSMLTVAPIWWATWMATAVIMAGLGFLLGYGLISSLLLSKNEEAKKKGEALLAKLAPLQGKLGLAAIVVGVWAVVARLIF